MAAPPSKRVRLAHLEHFRRKVPHVSASALSAVLLEAKESGIPDLHDRRDFREARDAVLDEATPYGPIYQSVDVPIHAPRKRQHLQVIHPLAFLYLLLSTCVNFSNYVESIHAAHPSSAASPWGLVLYSDEVTPGNQLAMDNKRKIQAVYFSFLEFGASLGSEDLWLTLTAKRSSAVNEIPGGMSQVFGMILKLFFVEHAFHEIGCEFKLTSGRTIRIYAKLKVFLQDGGAHKITWHCKGDSGHKFCLLCRNVFSKRSELADVDDDGDMMCDIIRAEDLDIATDEELIESARRVHHFHGIDDDKTFKARQIANGFSYTPYNMLCDPTLDGLVYPASQFMHDWMHCVFVSGVWNITTCLVFKALHGAGVRDVYALAYEFVSRWHWPKRIKQNKLEELFTPSRRDANNEAKKFKCQASQGLSVYGVLGLFFNLFPGLCDAQIKVYQTLCDLIDCFSCVQRGRGLITPKILLQRVHAFLNAFVTGFSANIMTPKFHWLLHFPSYLRRFGWLLACFVHERKHKMLKRYCNDIRNTAVFEHSVLREVYQQCCSRELFDQYQLNF